MQKYLLLITLFISSTLAFSQCTANYDFGEGVGFGVSPNPSLGEEFETGVVGEEYNDVIHILVPTDAGDINESYAGFIIDSLELTGISILNGTQNVALSTLGLTIECNNNGDSQNPCLFFGGNQYCAAISGIPNEAGSFPLTIEVLGHVYNALTGVVSVPTSFDQYVLNISAEGVTSLSEKIEYPTLDVEQNVPNPFKKNTVINFVTNKSGYVNLMVRNLLGEIVFQERITSKRGNNSYTFNSDELNSGIYMYSLDVNGVKVTKRMVINK